MEENYNQTPDFDDIQPIPRRRRRRRSKWQDFKEAYLPVIIAVAAIILIITFIVGAVKRGGKDSENPVSSSSSAPSTEAEDTLQEEQEQLLAQAEALAAQYDYEGAMNVLTSYSGDIKTSDALVSKYDEYYQASTQLTTYNDISQIPSLSVRLLIADMPRAMANEAYKTGFNERYLTTDEFSRMLQQLYDNGYMLVNPHDLAPSSTDANGNVTVSQGSIHLPADKKPLVLTQLGVNFFTYLIDSDQDGLPDQGGSGFPSRLVIGENGELTCEMVNADGATVTGSFDFVTILNDFIAAHPDFSYRGARAVLGVTGYDGLFGYRTDPETATKISQEYYDAAVQDVKPVIDKLRADGYDIACMSYDYVNYASMSVADIKTDLEHWNTEVKPLLGDVDTMILPYADIGDRNLYTGEIYELLKSYGFYYFIAMDSSTASWGQLGTSYARLLSREAGGANMYSHPDWYKDLFDSATVLDSSRSFG